MQHAMTMPMSTTARWLDTGAQVLIGATAIVAACIALTGAGRHRDVPQGRFRMAMEAYEAQQWPQAYAQLSAAADAGDPAAARVAAMMARQGPQLFGQHFDVSPERLQQWDRATRGPLQPAAGQAASPETNGPTDGPPPAVQVAGAR